VKSYFRIKADIKSTLAVASGYRTEQSHGMSRQTVSFALSQSMRESIDKSL
jgi:hypothetical protein